MLVGAFTRDVTGARLRHRVFAFAVMFKCPRFNRLLTAGSQLEGTGTGRVRPRPRDRVPQPFPSRSIFIAAALPAWCAGHAHGNGRSCRSAGFEAGKPLARLSRMKRNPTLLQGTASGSSESGKLQAPQRIGVGENAPQSGKLRWSLLPSELNFERTFEMSEAKSDRPVRRYITRTLVTVALLLAYAFGMVAVSGVTNPAMAQRGRGDGRGRGDSRGRGDGRGRGGGRGVYRGGIWFPWIAPGFCHYPRSSRRVSCDL
jgi:hypothetical protein